MDESLRGQESWSTPPNDSESQALLPALLDRLRIAKQFVLAHQAEAIVTLLLFCLAINLLIAISRKSITNDEIVHIPAGYYHLVAGDFQLNNEHPPLIKMWAALPLLLIQPNEPTLPGDHDENFAARTWGFHQLFWNANRQNFLAISFWTRFMMVPLTLTLGVVIFLFARRLFNQRVGVFAVALFTLEPTILAHGRVVHTDVPATLAYLLFFFALLVYSEKSTTRNAVLLALAAALAMLTKFSLVILAPVLVAYGIARLWSARRNPVERRSTLVHMMFATILIAVVINLGYYFQHPPVNSSDQDWLKSNLKSNGEMVLSGINGLSNVVPTYFLFGAMNVVIHNKSGHPASVLGAYGDHGWWYYFPVAFALKTTIPFLILSICATFWALLQLIVKRQALMLWVLVPLGIYLALSLYGSINIGIRHLLPAFSFLFILGGALLARLWESEKRRISVAIVVIVLGWMVIEVVRVFPDYTPYMNQLASRGPHWSYLSDSNVEWGDDVGELAAYLKAHGETKVRAALSGGWSTLPQYGVEFINMTPPDETSEDTRYVAIGASYLNGSVVPFFNPKTGEMTHERRINYFDEYRRRTPEAVFGGSIYLFREH